MNEGFQKRFERQKAFQETDVMSHALHWLIYAYIHYERII